MFRLKFALAITVLLGLAVLLLGSSVVSVALQSKPEPAPSVVISSEVLSRDVPVDVADPELALGRVTIMPGAVIPVHHHPGTQIGVVVQGTLTYSVFTGTVEWQRANAHQSAPHVIAAGETVRVPTGDALVEAPGSIHQGRNDGTIPVVIYLSTLFPVGAPRAIVGEATPTS
jgi:quercetin dioxygenase-like cupin family protein